MMLGKIKCWLGFHLLYSIMRLSPATELIGCRRCSRKWGMNHDVKAFLPWDADLREFYKRVYGIDRP